MTRHKIIGIITNPTKKIRAGSKNKYADIVVLTGDIFDENTPYQDMIDASKILGSIKNDQGIYFVYGNHERANYQGIEFTPEQIAANLEANGIQVLNDEVVCLDNINIIGRSDASFWQTNNRASMADLTALIPEDKTDNYTIVLDHQPLDLETNATLKIDLQLSGHTHGGQVNIPFILNGLYAPNQGLLPKYAGGLYNIDNGKNLIVSRGLSFNPIIPRIFNKGRISLGLFLV